MRALWKVRSAQRRAVITQLRAANGQPSAVNGQLSAMNGQRGVLMRFRKASLAGAVMLASFATTSSAFAAEELPFTLNDAAVLEPAADEEVASTVIRWNRAESVEKTVSVVKVRKEKRTRTVLKDGKEEEQTYIVAVPYTEEVVQRSLEAKPMELTLPLFKIAAWTLEGDQLSEEELVKRLANKTLAFLVKSPIRVAPPLSDQQRLMIREDALLVYSPDIPGSWNLRRLPTTTAPIPVR